jgi:hypothetical protein
MFVTTLYPIKTWVGGWGIVFTYEAQLVYYYEEQFCFEACKYHMSLPLLKI